jgi:DNA replication protein DnaC
LTGGSGTVKSHLLHGLGTAAEAGHRVRYTLASTLVNELVEAADDKQLSKTIADTTESTCSASTNWATWNSTAAAPSCCFRF